MRYTNRVRDRLISRRTIFSRISTYGRVGLSAVVTTQFIPPVLRAIEDSGENVVPLEQGTEGEFATIDSTAIPVVDAQRTEDFVERGLIQQMAKDQFPIAPQKLVPKFLHVFEPDEIWGQDGLFYTVQVDPVEQTIVHYALSATEVLVRSADGAVRLLRIVR